MIKSLFYIGGSCSCPRTRRSPSCGSLGSFGVDVTVSVDDVNDDDVTQYRSDSCFVTRYILCDVTLGPSVCVERLKFRVLHLSV
jgi:hypothetical protein